jgi:hypothetical protein
MRAYEPWKNKVRYTYAVVIDGVAPEALWDSLIKDTHNLNGGECVAAEMWSGLPGDQRLWSFKSKENHRRFVEGAADIVVTSDPFGPDANSADFDEWELSKLTQKVNADLLTFMSHYGRGALRPGEIREMNRLKRLSDKLAKKPYTPVPGTEELEAA